MSRLRDAWGDAHPFGYSFGWQFWPETPPAWYRRLVLTLVWLRRVLFRFQVAWVLVSTPLEHEDLRGWQWRAKALLLICGPVRWEYPDHRSHAGEVVGWDDRTWNGGEYTCWEASFVAIPPGLRLGLAHVYREGGP